MWLGSIIAGLGLSLRAPGCHRRSGLSFGPRCAVASAKPSLRPRGCRRRLAGSGLPLPARLCHCPLGPVVVAPGVSLRARCVSVPAQVRRAGTGLSRGAGRAVVGSGKRSHTGVALERWLRVTGQCHKTLPTAMHARGLDARGAPRYAETLCPDDGGHGCPCPLPCHSSSRRFWPFRRRRLLVGAERMDSRADSATC
jgi:hypothetical protein